MTSVWQEKDFGDKYAMARNLVMAMERTEVRRDSLVAAKRERAEKKLAHELAKAKAVNRALGDPNQPLAGKNADERDRAYAIWCDTDPVMKTLLRQEIEADDALERARADYENGQDEFSVAKLIVRLFTTDVEVVSVEDPNAIPF